MLRSHYSLSKCLYLLFSFIISHFLQGGAAAAPPPHPNDLDRLSGGAIAAGNLNGYASNNHRPLPPDVQSPGRTAPPCGMLEAQAAVAMETNERIVGLEDRLSAADREKLRLQQVKTK